MPKIGMRIIKSALAVFICFLVYILRGDGLPFYSTISAILCIQAGTAGSVKAARNRTAATFVGGIFGMIILIVQRMFFVNASEVVTYFIVSVAIIPLIYTMILLKYKAATPTSCIVFLSIAVNHAADVNPGIFAMNRIIDTLIGIFVALGVNLFHLPKKKNTNVLFVSELEDGLLDSKLQMSPYGKVSLEELVKEGAKIVLASSRTPGDLVSALNGIDINMPLITMEGAAVYDWNERSYTYSETINYSKAMHIENLISEENVNVYTHTIINDILHIYYGDFKNHEEVKFYNEEKLVPMKNYIYAKLPKDISVVYFLVIDNESKIEKIISKISSSELKFKKIKYNDEYYMLKIYSSEVSKGKALETLDLEHYDKVVAFSGDDRDTSLFDTANYGYAIGDIKEKFKERVHGRVKDKDHVSVIIYIRKLFYSKKIR